MYSSSAALKEKGLGRRVRRSPFCRSLGNELVLWLQGRCRMGEAWGVSEIKEREWWVWVWADHIGP